MIPRVMNICFCFQFASMWKAKMVKIYLPLGFGLRVTNSTNKSHAQPIRLLLFGMQRVISKNVWILYCIRDRVIIHCDILERQQDCADRNSFHKNQSKTTRDPVCVLCWECFLSHPWIHLGVETFTPNAKEGKKKKKNWCFIILNRIFNRIFNSIQSHHFFHLIKDHWRNPIFQFLWKYQISNINVTSLQIVTDRFKMEWTLVSTHNPFEFDTNLSIHPPSLESRIISIWATVAFW